MISTSIIANFPTSSAGNPFAVGAFAGPGDVPDSVLADPIIFFVGFGGGLFDYSVDNLVAGETTVRLFVAYEPLGDMVQGQTVNFMISSGTDFTVMGTIIPEPGTFLLLGGGLGILGLRASRRRVVR